MQISVSSTLTLYHDGQFWIGLVEHVEDRKLGVARIVFGAEPRSANGSAAGINEGKLATRALCESICTGFMHRGQLCVGSLKTL